MGINYFRDANHNYMVLGNLEGVEQDYSYRMVMENKMEGFLPCSMRKLNGEISLYYTIDSKVTLRNRYTIRKMSGKELLELFEAIRSALDVLQTFFMDESSILFGQDMIFCDLLSGKYAFACSPRNAGGGFSDFADSLLDLVDEEDEHAVMQVYKLCELAQNKDLSVRDMLRVTEAEIAEIGESSREAGMNMEEVQDLDSGNLEFSAEDESDIETVEAPKEEGRSSPVLFFVLAVGFIGVIGILLFIRTMYLLTYRENIITLAVMAVSAIFALLAMLAGVRTVHKNKKSGMPKENVQEIAYEEEEYLTYPSLSDHHLQAKKERPETFASEDLSYGATTLLNPGIAQREQRLYSRGGDKCIQISLDSLPLTVGKMPGYVDFLLQNESISRVHAMFYRGANDRICVKDLNSTNGTFRNGIRLQPQEGISLLPGDEICLGNLVFDYR